MKRRLLLPLVHSATHAMFDFAYHIVCHRRMKCAFDTADQACSVAFTSTTTTTTSTTLLFAVYEAASVDSGTDKWEGGKGMLYPAVLSVRVRRTHTHTHTHTHTQAHTRTHTHTHSETTAGCVHGGRRRTGSIVSPLSCVPFFELQSAMTNGHLGDRSGR